MWSKTTEYAVRALIYVAISNDNSHRPGFREVAEAIGAPVQFTAKILQTMARRKLLMSIRGKGGGFFFARDAEELKLSRVIDTFQGEDFFEGCLLGLGKCDPDNPCPLHDDFTRIRADLVRMAEIETIQRLARKIQAGNGTLKRL
ncbi:MAG: Rrf2 family transcriptional regulator [Bacteroidales bacterium]|jgi:Rrf2 family protein|nr:Rrf2 family transcriptional regulator [Bacteroidales bacterium]MDD2570987.1 Rrf2 family transcriptional regulator [Bacteroidales bacterium]MDD2812889.1 Rrf2 family transcriptional regulator [Bacteroidales bacterium]MDD3385599.1 Rrf2 family transcriptional regulator [Bacteroidales bacterium]MDD3811800.1 Rrf2 family transcriptional regulator [Bacteroidales bacterium]